MSIVRLIDIRDTPLSLDELYAAVTDERAGGIALFVGTVRNVDEGTDVDALGYSAHPTATSRLQSVADTIAAECDIVRLAAVHRIGQLAIGDIAVIVAVSAEHRAQAFEACRRLIDELKTDVPVWKQQTFAGGDAVWVGAQVDTTV